MRVWSRCRVYVTQQEEATGRASGCEMCFAGLLQQAANKNAAAGVVAAAAANNQKYYLLNKKCRYMSSPHLGVTIAIAIAIHNIPEGIALGVPLFFATGSRAKVCVCARLLPRVYVVWRRVCQ